MGDTLGEQGCKLPVLHTARTIADDRPQDEGEGGNYGIVTLRDSVVI
jgi:hypothetical protein